MKDFFSLGEVFGYYFRKKEEGAKKPDFNLKMMHGINKISIIVFLVGMIFFISKRLFF
ncbi:DUF6728 family protein [Reichenbachiella versicolor]|uniref:DUF6728 family protein n=1 Tax=Reichenbachiella versicolor TaxID=1821036 RepID=UPI001624FF08|nr:DUF6728 family protein [Reichenbachiella versicolor]